MSARRTHKFQAIKTKAIIIIIIIIICILFVYSVPTSQFMQMYVIRMYVHIDIIHILFAHGNVWFCPSYSFVVFLIYYLFSMIPMLFRSIKNWIIIMLKILISRILQIFSHARFTCLKLKKNVKILFYFNELLNTFIFFLPIQNNGSYLIFYHRYSDSLILIT